ncbi:MAG: MBL fold metallo-hydrolase [Verrucomicrobiae bacterium]|nr:MBL fold metallo-hydrolase [Verrucomicrobiae bacterium]
MKTAFLKCMGVGDGWPCADRGHAAFLYSLGSVTLLVDTGDPISGLLKKANWHCDNIDRVFVTHLHMDHVGGIFMLLQGLWLDGRTKPLIVHLPSEGIEPVSRMLKAGYFFDELIRFKLDFAPIQPGETVDVGDGVRVTAFPTSHLVALKNRFGQQNPVGFEAFCFVVEFDGKRVIHSGDVGNINDLAPVADQPTDVLVCELAHVTLEELGAFVTGHPVKKTVLVHLPDAMWRDLPKTREAAARALGNVPFVIPFDGDEIVI